ncbi:hypothetical protein BT63DRAFT_420000 [Microthyrium microscopicum]|uniref:Peptidase S28 n=1 Tax=Microthyrium microscopicum TaxID=703497 RepID=A0A6A6USH5_9PEZI|nr:hypothetical protein BT63DRAFT_420000 [Microthyrium microscopicum]
MRTTTLRFFVFLCTVMQLLAKVSAAQCPKYVVRQFAQLLDHNSTNKTTFHQSYQLDTSRYKPGGPILFYQGAESSQINCLEYNHFDDIAGELGAIVAGLEHRFFGDSFPAGVGIANVTAKDFAVLTLENVLLDAVNFVNWVKQTVAGASNAKVVINGGSYGGFLATVARTQHPETFYAAWASAPPLSAFGSQADNPDRFNRWDYISRVFQDQSFEASTKISKAMYDFESCAISEEACNSISGKFHLCGPQPANSTEWLELYSAVESAYTYATQFNSRIPTSFPISLPLQHILNQTLQVNDTGSILRIPAMLLNWQLNQSQCLDWKSPNITGGAVADVAMKSWEWIECNYMIYNIFSVRNGSMFPPQNVPVTCAVPEWTGPHFNESSQYWINTFDVSKERLESVGRLLITQQGYDPTTAYGPPTFDMPTSSNSTRIVFMPGLSHTEDFFSNIGEPVGFNSELDLVQNTITEIIKGWLA